jgi:hypothetical protein
MRQKEFKIILEEIFQTKYVYTEEYQDKYYLFKQIREKMPDAEKEVVYAAINYANNIVGMPRKSGKFIKAFIKKIPDKS